MFHGNEDTVYTYFNRTYVVSDPGLISTFFVFGKHKDVGDFTREDPFAPSKDILDLLGELVFEGDDENLGDQKS